MARHVPLIFITLLLSSSLLPVCTSEHIIIPGRTISGNQTIASAGGAFALGFFIPGNSSNSYLGIWYNTIPLKTVVWVANRESPLSKDSPGVFTMGNDGNLVILDGKGKLIWSSNVQAVNSALNNTIGVLMDTGNLVLRRGDDSTPLWQSFDYPSDTMLPGMKLSFNRKTGRHINLTSWAGTEDPRPGMYSLGIDPKGPAQLFIWKQFDPYCRSDVSAGSRSSAFFMSKGYLSYTCRFDSDEFFFTYHVPEEVKLKATLAANGQIQVLVWRESSYEWDVLAGWPGRGKCDFYDSCGPSASCDLDDSPSLCTCLTGFEPKVHKEWDNGNWTEGCVRQKGLRHDEGDGFLKFEKMKLPDHSISLGDMSVSDCELGCLQNGSCTAYAYMSLNESTTVSCLNWFGDLIDLVKNKTSGQVLYVRVHGSLKIGNGETHNFTDKKRLLAIAAALISIGLLLVSIFGYFLWRKRMRKQGGGALNMPEICHSICNAAGDGQNDGELSFFSFKSMLAATENFSEANKLGEGGFGPVYKGKLLEIQLAIKRLSTKSLQGLEEFMNELKLVAKLQHTNLVRILGCCVQGDEKILIYEYMPNWSLDKFLFDPSEKANLDWGKRFRIIEGIAQGLLYIHKYSRLKVIHRDLKASNILLDGAMNPKISDFGMARIFGINQTEARTNRVVGTLGYMSPEYGLYGQFSEKSDVYSFGVLLLEIVSGKKNTDFYRSECFLTLLEWAWEAWKEGRGLELLDPLISTETCRSHEVVKCIQVGLLCVQEAPVDRPTMSSVVSMIGKETASLPLPTQPAFSIRRGTTGVGSSSHTPSSYTNNEVTITTLEAR